MNTSVSVIIPSYNCIDTIRHTLQGLREQREQLINEIIIVDSSDDSKTYDFLCQIQMDHLRVIRLDERTWPAIARNVGARQATGKLLVFIDADVYLYPGWIESILKAYQDGCLCGGGSIFLPPFQKNRPVAIAQYYMQCYECLDSGGRQARKYVPSCNMYCDREIFERVGGFPEIRAAEDVLFGLSVNRITKVWFIPEARIYHIFRENLKGFLANQRLAGRFIIGYRKIHYKNFIYKGIMPLILLPAFSLIKIIKIFIRVVGAGRWHVLKFMTAFPALMLGMVYWDIGFAEGALQRISHEADAEFVA
ncbi:MAG: glycosyltransferase [Actinobacteria bacterium]|nr:glycosyltransferase [Actinomycetota bacterium]